jgi:hypothetical protein
MQAIASGLAPRLTESLCRAFVLFASHNAGMVDIPACSKVNNNPVKQSLSFQFLIY